MSPINFKHTIPECLDLAGLNIRGSLSKKISQCLLLLKFNRSCIHGTAIVAWSFEVFLLLQCFQFYFRWHTYSLYHCALWCFTSMYATTNIVACEVCKTSCECESAFALVNSLYHCNNKWADDRLHCCPLVITITASDDFTNWLMKR